MRRFLLRPSTHAYRGLLDSELRSLHVSSYVDKNLFISTLNGGFDAAAFTRLSVTLNRLQKYANDLEVCAKNIDPNFLKSDTIKLSEFILKEVSSLHNELEKEIMDINFSRSSSVDEEEDWDTEWGGCIRGF